MDNTPVGWEKKVGAGYEEFLNLVDKLACGVRGKGGFRDLFLLVTAPYAATRTQKDKRHDYQDRQYGEDDNPLPLKSGQWSWCRYHDHCQYEEKKKYNEN